MGSGAELKRKSCFAGAAKDGSPRALGSPGSLVLWALEGYSPALRAPASSALYCRGAKHECPLWPRHGLISLWPAADGANPSQGWEDELLVSSALRVYKLRVCLFPTGPPSDRM